MTCSCGSKNIEFNSYNKWQCFGCGAELMAMTFIHIHWFKKIGDWSKSSGKYAYKRCRCGSTKEFQCVGAYEGTIAIR